MVKSFHKKRKNFKNKTKRNKLRRTRKNKNKKMIGGEIGDTASYLGNHIFVGKIIKNNIKNDGNRDIFSNISNILVPKNISYDTKYMKDYYIQNDYLGRNIGNQYSFSFEKIRIINSLDYAFLFYFNGFNYNSIYEFYKITNIIIILPYLNLLPNLKNINIYRLISLGINFTNENDEQPNGTFYELLKSQHELIDYLADYVDLKYNNLVLSKNIPRQITRIGESGWTGKTKTKGETAEEIKTHLVDPNPPQQINGRYNNLGSQLTYFRPYIEELERTYPSLIARVLLETDAELAGEEPRENRMRRASSILEQGMKKFPSVKKKESEKNNEEIIEKISSEEKIKLPSSSSSLEIPSASSSSSEESPSNLKQIPIKSKKEKSTWIELMSTKYNLPYWVNSTTGDSVWEKPQELKEYDSDDIPFLPSSDDEEEIDITPYKVVTIDNVRYAALLSEINNQNIFNIYELKEYISPRNFKIESINPIGIFDKKNKKLKYNF